MPYVRFNLTHRIHTSGSKPPAVMLAYYLREGRCSPERNQERYGDLRHAEVANLPPFAHDDPYTFFQEAYTFERVNGRYASVLQIGLPRELSQEQQVALVHMFTKVHFSNKPHVWVLHEKVASDSGLQPHIHLIYSERSLDGIERDRVHFFKQFNRKWPERGGAEKDPFFTQRRAVKQLRKSWTTLVNWSYERAGREERVSPYSLYLQGIHRNPAGPFGRDGDPPDHEKENAVASMAWETYKIHNAITPDNMLSREWMIDHVREHAKAGLPRRQREKPTIQDRTRHIQALNHSLVLIRQQSTRVQGLREQAEYFDKTGKSLTPAMEERQRNTLSEKIEVPHLEIERTNGSVVRVRLFDDYEHDPDSARSRARRARVTEETRTHERGR